MATTAPTRHRSSEPAALADAARENQQIWHRDWVCVGVQQQIPNPGDLLPATVGDLGLHVQRQPGGGLRAAFNALQHGSCWTVPVQCRGGHKVQCPYVSCAFSVDSDALAAEHGEPTRPMRQFVGPSPQRLATVPAVHIGPLIFLNVAGESPTTLYVQTAAALRGFPVDLEALTYLTRLWLRLDCSWQRADMRVLAGLGGSALSAGWQEDTLEQLPAILDDSRPVLQVVFPNLLLVALPNHVAAIVLKPTGRASCLAMVALFGAAESVELSDHDEIRRALVQRWRAVAEERLVLERHQEHGSTLAAAAQRRMRDAFVGTG